jgi:ankyrin repeat protein
MKIKLLIVGALTVLISFSSHAKGSNSNAVYFAAAQQGDVATLQQFFATNLNAASFLNELFRGAVLAGQKDTTEFLLQRGAEVNKKGFIDMTPLAHLAMYGAPDDAKCAEVAKVLIAHGADVSAVDGYHATPILHAVEAKKSQMARVLLEHGANVVSRYDGARSGMTLLHMAVADKDKDMVAVLLEFKAPVDAVNHEGATALDMAEGRELAEIVAMLRAAKPNSSEDAPVYSPLPTKEEMRALGQRIASGDDAAFGELTNTMNRLYREIKDYRIERGRSMVLNARFYEVTKVLGEEAAKGNDNVVEALKKCLRPKTILSSYAPEALAVAAAAGNKEALDILIHYKDWDLLESEARFAICKPTAANFAPAVEESAKWLLSLKGMERNSGMADSTTNALAVAAGKGNQTAKDALEKFLAAAPPPEATPTIVRTPPRDPNVPARWAYLIGDQAMLDRVLAFTNLLAARDENGETPLLWAVKARQFVIARTLLEHGAEIPRLFIRNQSEWYMDQWQKAERLEKLPMYWAITHGDKEAVALLLEFKAPLDAMDPDDKTPLHYAVESQKPEIVRLLLHAKAPVDAAAKDGSTPLMLAETAGNEEIAQILRQAGAAPLSIPSREEMSAIAQRICAGDPASFDELVKAANDLYAGVDARKEPARAKLNQTRMGAAFGVLAEAASKDNENAFQALKKCLSQSNAFLKGAAPYSLGKAAAAGHAQAMDILVNYQQWGINQISAYFALTAAAKANQEPAVDCFIALASDPAAAKKQYYGIAYLVKEVLQSAAAQGNQKAQEALDKFLTASEQAKN